MKKHFITFGGGGQNYYDAVNRLVNQVKELNLFDNIHYLTDKDLQNDDYFWQKHSSFILNNKRGYGYWLWKPYVIKKTIEKMNDGDILLYLDCGCEIDIQNKQNLINNFNIVKKDYIIGTNTKHPEKHWNKMDLVHKLNMLDDKYLNSVQRQAGVVLYLICDKTRKLINEWYDIGCDYNNIDDSPSIKPNDQNFKQHRHDQSIFSLLTKKYNLFSNHSLDNSIKILRNKSGISKIPPPPAKITPPPVKNPSPPVKNPSPPAKIPPPIIKPPAKIPPRIIKPQPKTAPPIIKSPPNIVPLIKKPQLKIAPSIIKPPPKIVPPIIKPPPKIVLNKKIQNKK